MEGHYGKELSRKRRSDFRNFDFLAARLMMNSYSLLSAGLVTARSCFPFRHASTILLLAEFLFHAAAIKTFVSSTTRAGFSSPVSLARMPMENLNGLSMEEHFVYLPWLSA